MGEPAEEFGDLRHAGQIGGNVETVRHEEEQGGAPKGGWLVMGAMNVGKGKVIFLSSQFLLLNVQQPLMDRNFAFLIGKPG